MFFSRVQWVHGVSEMHPQGSEKSDHRGSIEAAVYVWRMCHIITMIPDPKKREDLSPRLIFMWLYKSSNGE